LKRSISFLLTYLLFVSYSFASNEIVVKPTLSSIKVFLNGAELKHSAKVKLDKGINEVVFTGIGSNIDRNSININGKGDGIIISIVQRFDYLRLPEKHPEVKALEDSLDLLNKRLMLRQNDSEVLAAQIDLILANKNISNEKIGVSISELQKMSEFFSKRLSEIKTQIVTVRIDLKRIQKDIDRVNKQLVELNNQLNKPSNEIAVTVSSKSSSLFDFDLSYLLYDAGWQPNYNIRVEKINSQAQLSYVANVWQNSGFDWNDVSVVLSTRNPNANNTKPELNPWFLNFYKSMPAVGEMKRGGLAKTMAMESVVTQDLAMPAPTMANYYEANQTQLAVEFTPSMKYSIPSDGKQHSVSLQEYFIKAKYEYYAVPKHDNNAFLVAMLTDWNEFNLMPGEANIYFENSYVGKTYLNPSSTKDTLNISLGRDENIAVSREAIKDFTENKFLSSDIERIFAYELKIKNNKKNSAKIIIEEQIPISQNEDIVVKLIESSGAKYNVEDGSLRWNVDAEAGKSISKKVVFSVKHPKDKQIQGM
jgi:uncharacterized protein (TIGR02231 family)